MKAPEGYTFIGQVRTTSSAVNIRPEGFIFHADLFSCEICGAVTDRPIKHTRWHDGVGGVDGSRPHVHQWAAEQIDQPGVTPCLICGYEKVLESVVAGAEATDPGLPGSGTTAT